MTETLSLLRTSLFILVEAEDRGIVDVIADPPFFVLPPLRVPVLPFMVPR